MKYLQAVYIGIYTARTEMNEWMDKQMIENTNQNPK